MKYRIIIVKGFHLHSPYNIQFKLYWYTIWKIIGGRYESIDQAKAAISMILQPERVLPTMSRDYQNPA